MINSRSTKGEILAAYLELKQQPTTTADVLLWMTNMVKQIRKEAVSLVKDCYNAGKVTRRWYDRVVTELSRPILYP